MSDLQTRVISGGAMMLVAGYCLWMGGLVFAALAVIAGVAMLIEWRALSKRIGWGEAGLVAGVAYVALPVAAIIALRIESLALALWTLAIVWATDIFAYIAGRSIGGPKIAPSISPSKTWAGLGGGMVGAGVSGALLAYHFTLPEMLYWLGVPLAVLAQAGDFFESWVKRRAGVKDSGKLLPGHGGVLDRLDGLVPVATIMGFLLTAGPL